MYVTVDVINTGDAPFSYPFHITVYKNSLGNTPKYTYGYPSVIDKNDTARITFGIPNYLSSWKDAADLVIRVNDTGNSFNDQAVCDSIYRDA
jgi:hypothetical protein